MSKAPYSNPIHITSAGQESTLKRIPLGEGAYNEFFVRDLVFQHPSSLPVDQIDRSYKGLIPVCKEIKTPAGPLDALYVTPEGRLVILEAKLWRNPEARRKVVAQVLDYAKELRRWDYEDLQREVSRCTQEKGNALYQLVHQRNHDISESDFVDEVTRNLAAGRFLLLIVGDGIREGTAAITDFLSGAGTLEFTFGLVELAIYQFRDNSLLVQPRVLAKTVIIQRSVVVLKENSLLFDEEVDELTETGDVELKPHEVYYSQFWPDFISQLKLDDASQPMPSRKPEGRRFGNIFFPMPPDRNQVWVTLYFSKKDNQIGVFLTMKKGDLAGYIFEKLKSERPSIEADLGMTPEWSEEQGKYKIIVRKNMEDLFAERNKVLIKGFFAETLNRFVNVFRPRLERIGEELKE